MPGLEGLTQEMIRVAAGVGIALVAVGAGFVSNRISKLIKSSKIQELKRKDTYYQKIINDHAQFQVDVAKRNIVPRGSVDHNGKVQD